METVSYTKNFRKFPLKKRLASRKDYSHAKTLGVSAVQLPAELLFLSTIRDQGSSEHCTAYASTATRESMKGVAYDPELQWKEEVAIYGGDTGGGVTIETAAATGTKTGFTPFGSLIPQDKTSAFFWVHKKGLDLFDTLRQTINQIQAPLVAGLDWYWDFDTPNGIIPNSFTNLLGGHCVKIAGFKQIGGVDYLVIQNSWGEPLGNNGLFYFSREMTNKCFDNEYGIFYWSDDQNAQVQRLGLISALLINLMNLYKRLQGL